MIRHGQSAANADTSIYNRVPDYRIPLTPLGLSRRRGGDEVRRQLGGRPVCVYVSPYLRAYQTLEALNLGPLVERVIEEPRLREQDWANFQIAGDIEDQKKELRNAYGHFFDRFREGESGSDVYDRISSFMETLHRHWSKPNYALNALFVTHGLTMRLFCMRWFHWSVEYFEVLEQPGERRGPHPPAHRAANTTTNRSRSGRRGAWTKPSSTPRRCSSKMG